MIKLNNQAALVNYLAGLKKAANAVIVISSPVKLNKKDVLTKTQANPFGEVVGVKTLNITLAANYEEAVNEMRAAEGSDANFKAGASAWGTRINDCIIEHNGQLYLGYIENFKEGKTLYECDGKSIKWDDIAPFAPSRTSSITRQGVDIEVKYRRVKLDNLIGLTVEGVMNFSA